MVCRICNSNCNQLSLRLKEMMFGTAEEFDYFICNNCLTIQILSIPSNSAQYYPDNYYSFNSPIKGRHFLKKIKQILVNILSLLKGDYYEIPEFSGFGITYKDRNKAILDIGCGDGRLLFEMRDWSFRNLTGIDPLIKKNYSGNSIKLLNIPPEEIEGMYDIIMSHHSLEHMPDPNMFFRIIHEHLKPTGKLILRIPIYPNYIWDKYSVRWIQLDPPRHLYIFSIKTIEYLCKKNKLIITNLVYDSEAWALAGTEFSLNGKPYKEFEKNVYITEAQYTSCRIANEMKNGDSVCFTISKDRG
jgi:SAM-dependent methyltransferase